MLYLKSIILTQFKNYSLQQLQFNQPIIAFTGANGVGKTNLLDAIHYLCFTKSYFTGVDSNNVQHGHSGFRIEGVFKKNSEAFNTCIILRENGKKEITCNEVPYEKFSQHIGLFPCVMIAPDDVELIIGGSELRRKFLDTLLSQINAEYLQHLISYNKILQQRNSYLKQCAQTQTKDHSLLEVLDELLVVSGNFIYQTRNRFLPSFQNKVLQFYKQIAGKEEAVLLTYESQLSNSPFETLLTQSRERDYLLQRTNYGVHKDDLVFTLNNEPFKTTASQGQRKSLLFSLKLAEAETIKEQKGFYPLLLLDDVFEKLDTQRMHNLLEYVCSQQLQVFITDPNEERVRKVFEDLGKEIEVYSL
ncbi:MAG: DNA replication and repair protein RecF [Chitinophagaceae bacterium]|nr:DNA replication and repair protein RecF [Chitinophagaceae bacterium]